VPVAADVTTPEPMRARRLVVRVALAALLSVGAAVAVRAWAVYPARVTSGSMSPTLLRGDWLASHKLTGRDPETVRRSQIVLFRFPFGSSGRAVKRIVAVAGDQVEIGRRFVRVNGHTIPTAGGPDFAVGPDGKEHPLPFRERIPAGHVFLLGDNTAASIDSRSFGPAPDSELVGRVWFALGLPAWWLLALLFGGALAAALVLIAAIRGLASAIGRHLLGRRVAVRFQSRAWSSPRRRPA
jgi:signal peptidase I